VRIGLLGASSQRLQHWACCTLRACSARRNHHQFRTALLRLSKQDWLRFATVGSLLSDPLIHARPYNLKLRTLMQ